MPPMVIAAPSSVRERPSNAASFVGCVSATCRAAQSPTMICTGAAQQANERATTSAVRW